MSSIGFIVAGLIAMMCWGGASIILYYAGKAEGYRRGVEAGKDEGYRSGMEKSLHICKKVVSERKHSGMIRLQGRGV